MKQKRGKSKRIIIKLVILAGVLLSAFFCRAAVNRQINYQGKLTDTNDVAVADGNYDFVIRIYDSESGGTCLWSARGSCASPTARSVAVSKGIFSIMLGDTAAGDNPLNLDFSSDTYYLGIKVGSDNEMTPRKRLGSVPQAINALNLVGDGYIDIGNTASAQDAVNISYNPTSGANDAVEITYGSGGGTGTALNIIQAGSGLALRVNDDGTATDTTPFVIDASGNVGIGTTNPLAKLDVRGAIYGGTNGTEFQVSTTGALTAASFNGNTITSGTGTLTLNNKTLTLNNSLAFTGADGKTINFGTNNLTFSTSGDYTLTIPATGTAALGTGTANYLARWTGTNTLSTGSIYDNGTNVGIGTTDVVNYKLNVNGSVNATAYYLSGSPMGTVVAGSYAGQTLYWNGSSWAASGNLFNNNTNVGIGTTAPSQALELGASKWLSFEGTTEDSVETIFQVMDPTGSDKIITFQNNSGIVPLSTSGNTLFFTTSGNTSLTLPTSGTVTALGNTTTGSGSTLVLSTSPTFSTSIVVSSGTTATLNSNDLTFSSSNPSFKFADAGSLYFSDGTNNLAAIKDQGSYVYWNLAGKSTTGDPATCSEGDIYYNAVDDTIKICHTGNTWEALDGGGGGVTLQSAYDYTGGNTILTTSGRDIAFILGEVATPTKFSIENQDTAGNSAEYIKNSITSGTLAAGLLIEQTGAGTMTDAIKILETAGTITTGLNLGNNLTTGISIGTGVTTGISIASGGIIITGGALAINNSTGITSNQSTLVINASGTVDIQDILNADSVTTDTGGVTIAAGQSYTGAGAVTLSSASGTGLTINSGTTGTLAIGDDASAETINIGTGAAAKTLTIGSTNTTSTTTVQSGSGGISLQANGTSTGNVQIGDGGAASATPDLLVLDTGSAEPAGTNGAMYYSTTLNKFRCYQNSSWTDCIGTGSGGSPGGSNTDIQFNDSGSFGGDADFGWDKTNNTLILDGTDTEINLAGVTNEPSSPSAGNLYFYSKSVGGRMMPKWKGPAGVDTPVQPFFGMNKIGYWNPPGNGTTVPGVFGFPALTASGTATARNVATTNLFTRTRRLGYVYSTAGSNVVGGARVTVAQYTVGDGSGLGGFFMVTRFGESDTVTDGRMFVGMTSSTAAPSSVEPSTLTNAIGVGCGTANTNLYIYYGGSAAQTPINLGSDFPCNTNPGSVNLYELVLFAPPNSNNTVYYRVTRLGTSYEASGTLTAATPGTQLPASTTLLTWQGWRATAATSGSPAIDIVSIYIETDY